MRELDDAVALGLGARARGEPLVVAPGADRHGRARRRDPVGALAARPEGKGARGRYAFAEAAVPRRPAARGCRARRESTSPSATSTGWSGVIADVANAAASRTSSFDQALLVSTLEHVGADNTGYGLSVERRPGLACRGIARARPRASAGGRLLVTVPLGEPGDHGWFRLDDVDGWNGLFAEAGLFVEEEEAYELDDGRVAGCARVPRVPESATATAARLRRRCSARELSPGRLRRLVTPDGLARTLKRRARPSGIARRLRSWTSP